MKKLLSLTALSMFALTACNGADPEEDCRTNAKASCERMYTCDAALKFGDDQADCENDLATLCIAAVAQAEATNDGEPCEAGQKYDASAAEECSDGIADQSCEDYNAGNSPAACDRVCTAS